MIKNDISWYSLFCENNRLTSRFHDVEMSEPINDRRKLEYKMKHFQQNLNRLKVENGASGKFWKLLENDRNELENELISCKSRIDQLESDNRRLEIKANENHTEVLRKQEQIEFFEAQNNELTSENAAAKNELIKCKSRIDELEANNQRLEDKEKHELELKLAHEIVFGK